MKKVEIVAEAAIAKRLLAVIDAAGATGYTVVPEVAGRGHRGVRDEAHVSDAFRNVLVIVIASAPTAARIVAAAHELLSDYAGIVYASDVEVVRPEHFG